MNDRIEILLDEIDMSPSLFADAIGVQRATISHILSGRNNPSLDFVQKVLGRFPDINPDWILSGKGDIWRKTSITNSEQQAPAPESVKQKRQSKLFAEEEKSDEASIEKNLDKAGDKKIVAESDPKESKAQNPAIPERKPPPTGVSLKKQIVKVIVLYNDHTFEDYSGG